jgi:predicted RNase H-like nuclease (RuvC/YqgF family)
MVSRWEASTPPRCTRVPWLQAAQAYPSTSDSEKLASLQKVIAAYSAKASAQEQEVSHLQNLISVCELKAAEARQHLAEAAGSHEDIARVGKTRKQLEDRTTVMQQRLNTALATNAKLRTEIDERRHKVRAMLPSACSGQALCHCHSYLESCIL